jgi:hypothetical protein
MNEEMNMRGAVTVQLSDREGRIVYERRQDNRIVRTGRDLVARLFAGTTSGTPPSKVTHMAVGTDGTAATDDQTALGKERPAKDGVQRKPIEKVAYSDFVETGTGVKRVRVSLSAVFDFDEANGTDPLREAGVFTAATGGVMYNRVVFADVTKTNAFKLTLLWDITF